LAVVGTFMVASLRVTHDLNLVYSGIEPVLVRSLRCPKVVTVPGQVPSSFAGRVDPTHEVPGLVELTDAVTGCPEVGAVVSGRRRRH
jgi:hypothetical protein